MSKFQSANMKIADAPVRVAKGRDRYIVLANNRWSPNDATASVWAFVSTVSTIVLSAVTKATIKNLTDWLVETVRGKGVGPRSELVYVYQGTF